MTRSSNKVNDRQQSSTKQKIFLTFCAFILILLCYQAVRMTSANLNFYQAFQLKELWFKNNELTSKSQYDDALRSIDRANKLHPNNPQYLITQGLVLEWGGISDIFSEKDKIQNLQLAKGYYLRAVELRPTWPVTWATLAILKWRLNEIDQSLIDYLQQADKFGQHTLDVHNAWVDVGFYLYMNKSPYTVQIMKKLRVHLELMLKDDRMSIRQSAVNIIKRHNAQRQVCKWLASYKFDTVWHQTKLCPVVTV